MVAIGDHSGEHVQAAGRALGVGLRANLRGEMELLDQRDEVGTVALERGSVAKVYLLEGQILDLLLDGGAAVRQEAAAQRPRELAERSEEHTSELQSLRHLVCR